MALQMCRNLETREEVFIPWALRRTKIDRMNHALCKFSKGGGFENDRNFLAKTGRLRQRLRYVGTNGIDISLIPPASASQFQPAPFEDLSVQFFRFLGRLHAINKQVWILFANLTINVSVDPCG